MISCWEFNFELMNGWAKVKYLLVFPFFCCCGECRPFWTRFRYLKRLPPRRASFWSSPPPYCSSPPESSLGGLLYTWSCWTVVCTKNDAQAQTSLMLWPQLRINLYVKTTTTTTMIITISFPLLFVTIFSLPPLRWQQCEAQELRLNLVYTVGAMGQTIPTILWGWLLDVKGPRFTLPFAGILFGAGCLLFAYSDSQGSTKKIELRFKIPGHLAFNLIKHTPHIRIWCLPTSHYVHWPRWWRFLFWIYYAKVKNRWEKKFVCI